MNLEAIYDEMQWHVIKRFVFYMPNNEYSKMLFDDETLIGMDCSNSAEQTKHLFKHPNIFIAKIDKNKVNPSTIVILIPFLI